jgi:putative flippase GtrA
MINDEELKQIFRFLVIGLMNTCIGLGAIYACKYFGQIGDVRSNIIGYVVAVTNSFFWNRRWTFAHTGDMLLAARRFLGLFCVAYLTNLATVMVLIRMLSVDDYLAHSIATIPYTAIFYLGSRFFVFNR